MLGHRFAGAKNVKHNLSRHAGSIGASQFLNSRFAPLSVRQLPQHQCEVNEPTIVRLSLANTSCRYLSPIPACS